MNNKVKVGVSKNKKTDNYSRFEPIHQEVTTDTMIRTVAQWLFFFKKKSPMHNNTFQLPIS
jgi:hypothetical protein